MIPTTTGWDVFEYERDMANKLSHHLPGNRSLELPWELENAIVEALVLHTRVLVEMIVGNKSQSDDITLRGDLLPGFSQTKIDELNTVYNSQVPGFPEEQTARWQFNKLLAHATRHRLRGHDYLPALKQVWHVLLGVLDDIDCERLKST